MNLLNYSVFSYGLSVHIIVIENRNSLFLKDIKETFMLTLLYRSFVMGQHLVVDGRNHVE